MFLEISQKSLESTCARATFLIRFQASGLQLYLKRESGTGVFLWILLNSKNIFLHRTPPVAAFPASFSLYPFAALSYNTGNSFTVSESCLPPLCWKTFFALISLDLLVIWNIRFSSLLHVSLFPFIFTFLYSFLKTLVCIIFLLKLSNCVIHFSVSFDFKIEIFDFKIMLSHELILKSSWDNF